MELLKTLKALVIDDEVDPEVATDKALELASKEDIIALVRPVILDRARAFRRDMTRDAERVVFKQQPKLAHPRNKSVEPETLTPIPDRTEALRRLNLSKFPVGKRYVEWPEATEEEHLWRANWQRQHASSSIQTAECHEKAAALIVQHGVVCLREIPNWEDLL